MAAVLQHSFAHVRRAALVALPQIAAGDAEAVAAVAVHLEHKDSAVRRTAVEALAKVAQRGDASAVAAVAARLGHPDAGVRQTALAALGRVGDAGAIAAAAACFEDPDIYVRHAAVGLRLGPERWMGFSPSSARSDCGRCELCFSSFLTGCHPRFTPPRPQTLVLCDGSSRYGWTLRALHRRISGPAAERGRESMDKKNLRGTSGVFLSGVNRLAVYSRMSGIKVSRGIS